MSYITYYQSPIGKLLLASDDALIGVWFEDQKYYASTLTEPIIEKDDLDIFKQTRSWLDQYFLGMQPSISDIALNFKGSDFRKRVWQILCEIPYGETMTYQDIALIIAKERGITKMSAQAIGNAVGHNPISIIVPCHRVIGSHGELTGYAGGLDKKEYLLMHEKKFQ